MAQWRATLMKKPCKGSGLYQLLQRTVKKAACFCGCAAHDTAMQPSKFNDLSGLSTYLTSRRSARPRDMVAPGPTDEDIRDIISCALRTPDHGKLTPWRVISVSSDQRGRLAAELKTAYLKEKPHAGRTELEGLKTIAHEAPCLLVILSSPKQSSKIPVWEQELSCGAFCMNILHSLHARGFVGGWITGWPAFNSDVRNLFGHESERIAGFIFSGTADCDLTERPRPALNDIFSHWDPDQNSKPLLRQKPAIG